MSNEETNSSLRYFATTECPRLNYDSKESSSFGRFLQCNGFYDD